MVRYQRKIKTIVLDIIWIPCSCFLVSRTVNTQLSLGAGSADLKVA